MKNRIHFLDEYRGLALAAMLLYHTWYDMAEIFGYNMPWFYTNQMHLFQQWIGMSFIFVSGMCCMLSKNNLKRGLTIFAAAMGMTIVTSIAMPSQIILFGVLHLLGLCSIISALIVPRLYSLSRSTCFILAVVFLILFNVTYYVPNGYLKLFSEYVTIDSFLYSSPYAFFLGFPNSSFYSSDYYPIIPWLFLFLTGMFLMAAVKDKIPAFFCKPHIPFLSLIGRHTLLIYLVHQPLIYGVLSLIQKIKMLIEGRNFMTSVAVIGGADGPTAIYVSGGGFSLIFKLISISLVAAVLVFLVLSVKKLIDRKSKH